MWFKRKKGGNNRKERKDVEMIHVTVEDMRIAVNTYANQLDSDVSLRTIIKDNHEIDNEPLTDFLGGRPDRSFYMAKETFEIFEDPEYPKWIDLCQIACDQYFLETGEEPVLAGDPARKLNYLKVKDYLKEKPPFDLYLHSHDRMVTHRMPENK
ncbi:DUF3939 domain-containing protein [Alteribacter populi]|uniref:DUF3939 domain-containing protein n=1 Tax=Alteribacter populi TaxID=2011011 RepID=UPI000BBB4F12|nr:DUF3939 domain-containing protein [Alteribacter populi]